MMASALLSGAPPARRGAGHPRPDGKAEKEPIVELSATTATPPAGMRGPASRAAIIQGLLAAPAGRANPPAVLAGFGAFRRSEPGAGMTGMCERSSSRI